MKASAAVLLVWASCVSASAMAGPDKPGGAAVIRTVDVTLPNGTLTFPPGVGSNLANAQCVICHSAGMVTRQPPLSFQEWKAEVAKMRAVYGAPLAADEVDQIARYLTAINGKP
ncbi:cytochrome c [Paraburkholderia sp. MM5384-R2]|uniref:cytochrome c n=1 Tax=Paraburkholderia sp. MM5384-R2 TaxID=2723097 RepID=UPI001610C3C2|nr:cytochrome c [Paraburkholderia sp. MM5384-R2]MBB5496034.1 mono/diheme cytochrome c family protein [Paraburkholderia sp. MM5384-R2]